MIVGDEGQTTNKMLSNIGPTIGLHTGAIHKTGGMIHNSFRRNLKKLLHEVTTWSYFRLH